MTPDNAVKVESPRELKARVKGIARRVRELRRLESAISMYGHNVPQVSERLTYIDSVRKAEQSSMEVLQNLPKVQLIEALL